MTTSLVSKLFIYFLFPSHVLGVWWGQLGYVEIVHFEGLC